jgi:hypothetical protein
MMNATNKQYNKQTISTQSSSIASQTTQITSQQAPNKLKTGSILNANSLPFNNSRSQPQSLPIHHSNGTIIQQAQQHHHHHQQQQQQQQQQQHNNQHSNSNNVKFTGFHTEKIDEREKYLTAKYPNHQMALIKKRLKVEFWIDDKLKLLFNVRKVYFNLESIYLKSKFYF